MREPSPVCVVCERTGAWARALRTAWARRGPPGALRFVETRSPAEARRRLDEFAADGVAAALVVEATTANDAIVAGLLSECVRRSGTVPLWGLAEPADSGCEALVREAGATGFSTSRRALEPLIDALTARVDEVRARPVRQEASASIDDLRRRLPWGDD